jgi:hypothetical protein
MIPSRKIKLPERKPENAPTRIQLNRTFDTEAEMERFVKENHPTATIKQFWPSQVLNCIIEIPCIKK